MWRPTSPSATAPGRSSTSCWTGTAVSTGWSITFGGLDSRSSFLDVTDDQWSVTFELNFHSAVRMSRAAIPALLVQGGGSLVHVASEAARFPDTTLVDYAAAKTALLSVSKTLAAEFGLRGIRSNIVSPGPTRTRLWDTPGGFAEQLAAQFDLPIEEGHRALRPRSARTAHWTARHARRCRQGDRPPAVAAGRSGHRCRVGDRRRLAAANLTRPFTEEDFGCCSVTAGWYSR